MRRLQALARGQSVLTKEGFEGAPVAEIIRLEFEAFSNKITAVGPVVMLNSRAAQTFALLVHELATNASKHGALSGADKGPDRYPLVGRGCGRGGEVQVSMAGTQWTAGRASDPHRASVAS